MTQDDATTNPEALGSPDVPPPPAPAASGPASTPSGEGGAAWKPSYVFLVVLTVVNLVADIGTKQWIKHHFESGTGLRAARKIEVIPNYMNLIFATNKGGAWGILQGETEALRRPFFLSVSVLAIVFILSLYRKLTPEQRALKWGLPLVLGGALGNLVDRILYGWVIDFIDCYTKVGADEKHWPTFNVADIAICIGVGLMAIDMFTSREGASSGAKPSTPATQTPGDAAGAQVLDGSASSVTTEERAPTLGGDA